MKKMTFALACASTFALFAAPISSIGFEGYTSWFGPGLSGSSDNATSANDAGGDSFWYYEPSSSSDDASTVKTYEGDNLAKPTGPLSGGSAYQGGVGNNYLELSTEGGTLWRSINRTGSGDSTDPLGEAQTIGAEGLYIDTMVQFTPTEDGQPPETVADDKLAIWLDVQQGENNTATTNLMVKAGGLRVNVDEGSEEKVISATYALTDGTEGFSVKPGTWYRLTVKAVPNLFTIDSYDMEGSLTPLLPAPGFKIFLDGVALKSSTKPIADVWVSYWQDGLAQFGVEGLFTSTTATELSEGQIFPPLGEQGSGEAMTLQGVGFKGSGAIDDLVFTAENPIQAVANIDFTIAVADGVTVEWSKDAGANWTTGTSGSAPAGSIQVRLTNADGATKIVTATLAADAYTFDYASETFGWAEYLGALVDGAYVIDDAAEMLMFKKGFDAGLATAKQTFKLAADIALTDSWAGIGTYVDSGSGNTDWETDVVVLGVAFQGTFDGNGKKISNVTFANNTTGNNYRGFFNQIYGATIKNLTVEGDGFGDTPPSDEYGCALVVGCAYKSEIDGCVSMGTIASATHNAGGIVVHIRDTTVKNCTNKADITGNYTKIAGIAVINQSSATGCMIENCVNEGDITAGNGGGRDGVAGIIAYIGDATLTIKNCENKGIISRTEGSVYNAEKGDLGQIVGWEAVNITAAAQGTNKGLAGMRAIGVGTIDGLNYATVADGVATYVTDATLVAGGSYLVTANGLTPTIALAAGDSITFDTALATITATGITAAADADEITTTEDGTKTTYTAQTKQPVVEYSISLDKATANVTVGSMITLTATVSPEGTAVTWVSSDDTKATVDGGVVTGVESGEVTITATAGDKSATCVVTVQAASSYPTYIPEGDTVKQEKYDTWATTHGADTTSANEEAFLLDVAPTEQAVEEAKAKFKILSVTIGTDNAVMVTVAGPNGTATYTSTSGTVTTEDGKPLYNGTVEIKGSETVNGTFDLPQNDSKARFFKAILK